VLRRQPAPAKLRAERQATPFGRKAFPIRSAVGTTNLGKGGFVESFRNVIDKERTARRDSGWSMIATYEALVRYSRPQRDTVPLPV
jgi:hypothetical protein